MKVGYIGPCLDSSGYAEAARNHIAALNHVGVKVIVRPISNEPSVILEQTEVTQLIKSLITDDTSDKVQIIHTTPETYDVHLNPSKYNIGYAAWETDSLPTHWVENINQLDEIWAPCKHNVEVFKNSGVKIPIFCIPHPFIPGDKIDTPSIIPDIYKDYYKFYSVFQWTARKNPEEFFKAYLTEFGVDEKVILIFKTYLKTPGDEQERIKIKEHVNIIKHHLNINEFPKMLLVNDLLSRDQMVSLHKESDCYISMHRAEGFGMPIMEAMLAGNPVITTGYGGPEDFVKHNGLLIDYSMTPVYGMPWEIYNAHMLWADPDIMDAREHMRYVFEYQETAKLLGELGRKRVTGKFSLQTIGEKMKHRLEEIHENLS